MSAKTMVKQIVDATDSNKNIDVKMMDSFLESGLYFNKAWQPVKAIK